jgi:hypothetical protein
MGKYLFGSNFYGDNILLDGGVGLAQNPTFFYG